MEYTKSMSYDEEIASLDAKHQEQMDSMSKAMQTMQSNYMAERCRLVEIKVRKELVGNATENYLDEPIDVELCAMFIRRSTGYIYKNLYIVGKEQPTKERNIPAHRKGGRYLFTRRELREWLLAGDCEQQQVEKEAQAYLQANPK